MATMGRTKPSRHWAPRSSLAFPCASRSGVRSPSLALATVLSLTAAGPVFAQNWYLNTGIDASITGTSNANYGFSPEEQADTIIGARPYLSVRSEGGRLRLYGTASLDILKYVKDTQDQQIHPTADLSGRLEAIERFFFIEAGLNASQTNIDVFGSRPATATNVNTLTTTQWRLSPYIEGTAGNDLRYLLRSDNSWTNSTDQTIPDSYFARNAIRIGRDPRPLGWRFDAERTETRYDDATTVQPSAVSDSARVELNYSFGPDLSGGVRGGTERNNFSLVRGWQNIYGVQAAWKPSERTDLTGFWEERYFGSGWRLAFNHRTPFVAWNLLSSRDVSTTPQSLFDLPASSNVAGLLDAMFTTRFPDPVARAKAVQDFIDRQGLPTSTLTPVTLYASRLSIVTNNLASLAFIGRRNTVSFAVYKVRTEDLVDSGDFALGTASVNNVQRGVAIGFSHVMTPTTNLSASATWSRISALEGFGDQDTKEAGLLVRLNERLTPKTTAFVDLRLRRLEPNATAISREAAVTLGLGHAF